jgi:hypothetical protein
MVIHICNSCTQKAEAGGSQLQASLDYTGDPIKTKQNKTKNNNKNPQVTLWLTYRVKKKNDYYRIIN